MITIGPYEMEVDYVQRGPDIRPFCDSFDGSEFELVSWVVGFRNSPEFIRKVAVYLASASRQQADIQIGLNGRMKKVTVYSVSVGRIDFLACEFREIRRKSE